MLTNSSKLLLVDDDSQLAAMLHEYLELQGFQVELCEDGESALQKTQPTENRLTRFIRLGRRKT